MSLIQIFLLAKGKSSDKLDRRFMEWAVVGPGEGQTIPCDTCKQLEPSIAYFRKVKDETRVLCKHCYVREFEYKR